VHSQDEEEEEVEQGQQDSPTASVSWKRERSPEDPTDDGDDEEQTSPLVRKQLAKSSEAVTSSSLAIITKVLKAKPVMGKILDPPSRDPHVKYLERRRGA
jgi:hypothetical protein